MNIKEFKEDDIITRSEPVKDEDGIKTKDRSYMGDKLQLVGIQAGKIVLLNLDFPSSPDIVDLETDWYSEGWDYYPEGLIQKAIAKVKNFAKERFPERN